MLDDNRIDDTNQDHYDQFTVTGTKVAVMVRALRASEVPAGHPNAILYHVTPPIGGEHFVVEAGYTNGLKGPSDTYRYLFSADEDGNVFDWHCEIINDEGLSETLDGYERQ